jgi:hypothetical protein
LEGERYPLGVNRYGIVKNHAVAGLPGRYRAVTIRNRPIHTKTGAARCADEMTCDRNSEKLVSLRREWDRKSKMVRWWISERMRSFTKYIDDISPFRSLSIASASGLRSAG